MALTLKELQSQIDELREKIEVLANNSKSALIIKKNLGIGDTFELLNLTWKILDITDKGYVCLAGKLEDSMQFDGLSNDWKSSDLREYLTVTIAPKSVSPIWASLFSRRFKSLAWSEYSHWVSYTVQGIISALWADVRASFVAFE